METLERLVDLVILLVNTRVPLTFAQIRDRFPEGYPQANIESAKRMFERDKDVARAIGVPLEVVTDELGAEPAYAIPRDRFYLPPVEFTPEELAALLLGVRGGAPQDPAAIAAGKILSGLRDAGGGEERPSLGAAVRALPLAGADGAERLLEVWGATVEREAIAFDYRSADGSRARRSVDPYRIVFRGGRWYLVGNDRDRGAVRVFRMSRFLSDCTRIGPGAAPPADFRADEHLAASPTGPTAGPGSALVAFAPDVAWPARRSVETRSEELRADGWVVLEIPSGDAEWLASWVLSFGADAEVVAPEPLRAEVVARLEAAGG